MGFIIKGGRYVKLNRFGKFWDKHVACYRKSFSIYSFSSSMHGAINIRITDGWLCFAYPKLGFNLTITELFQTRRSDWLGWYVYISRDGTPGNASFSIGPGGRRPEYGSHWYPKYFQFFYSNKE